MRTYSHACAITRALRARCCWLLQNGKREQHECGRPGEFYSGNTGVMQLNRIPLCRRHAKLLRDAGFKLEKQ